MTESAQKSVSCQQCGGEMERTILDQGGTGRTALALIVAIVGVALLFYFPLGTVIGVLLLIAAPKLANKTKNVWKCMQCGYFFERA